MTALLNGLQRVIFQVADQQRKSALSNLQGTVHEVKEDKMRVVIGQGKDGQPVLSPWLHTGNHRSGATERRLYKKGQNVILSAPNGDLRQAEVQAYAENEKFKAPDHAEDKRDEENYQLGELRVRKSGETYTTWLGGKDGKDAKGVVRMSKEKGVTVRVGDNMRFHVSEEGVRMRAKDDFALITKEGKLIISKPWEIGQDPMTNDDAVDDPNSKQKDEQQQGQGEQTPQA